MKISIENLKTKPLDWREAVWGSNVVEDYRLVDVDYLQRDRGSDPLYRLKNAEIMAALFVVKPIPTCRFVVDSPALGKAGLNIYNTEDRAAALRQAMEAMGAEIEVDPDEWPAIEDYLAAFAQALGVTNIAISR